MLNIVYKISEAKSKTMFSEEEVMGLFDQKKLNSFIQLLMPENALFIIASENVQVASTFQNNNHRITPGNANNYRFKLKANSTFVNKYQLKYVQVDNG